MQEIQQIFNYEEQLSVIKDWGNLIKEPIKQGKMNSQDCISLKISKMNIGRGI